MAAPQWREPAVVPSTYSLVLVLAQASALAAAIQLTTSVRSRSATAATGAVVILLTQIATSLASLILAAITISRRRIHLLAPETLVGTTTPDFEPVQYASSPLLYSPNRHLRRRSSSAALSEKLLPETLKETTKILKTRPVDSTLAILVEQLGEDGWWNMVVIGALFLLNDALTSVAASTLPPSLFALSNQLKIPASALLALVLQGDKLSTLTWIALASFTIAGATALTSIAHAPSPGAGEQNSVLGLFCIVVAVSSFAVALNYYDVVIRKRSTTTYTRNIWTRNAQLSLTGAALTGGFIVRQFGSSLSLDDFHLGWRGFLVVGLQALGYLLIPKALKATSSMRYVLANFLSIAGSVSIGNFLSSEFSPFSVFACGLVVASASDASSRVDPRTDDSARPSWRRLSTCLLFVTVLTSFVSSIQHPPERHDTPPTICVLPMPIGDKLIEAARGCGWGLKPYRQNSEAAYGPVQKVHSGQYQVAHTDQFSLDDILASRFMEYSGTLPENSTETPDFIFLPLFTMFLANPWHCHVPEFKSLILETVVVIRELVASLPPSSYPRIILPIAPIRYSMEDILLTPEIMSEIKNDVIVMSIEGAPNRHREGMDYVIDVPYPTWYHLLRAEGEQWQRSEEEDFMFNSERPYLMHYTASATHPWGAPDTNPFNGFKLRAVLQDQFVSYLNASDPTYERARLAGPRILLEIIDNPVDGFSNMDLAHKNMQRAIFCPQPPGDSPSRRGFYDAVQNGCIPVIFREFSYKRLFPASPEMDSDLFTVFIPEQDLIDSEGYDLITRLSLIPAEEIRRKQEHLRQIGRKLQWGMPSYRKSFPLVAAPNAPKIRSAKRIFDEDAFGMVLKELDTIKKGEWEPRRGIDADKRIIPVPTPAARL